jgi:hypothetical protein
VNLHKIAISILLLVSVVCFAQAPAEETFSAMKTLAGNWTGKSNEGAVRVSFEVISGGSVLMSRLRSDHENMVTMFHLDQDRLSMTHYCDAGNQPHMNATASPDGKTITFDFLDATNLHPGQPGHMKRLVLSLLWPDHHTETWIFDANGTEETDTLDLHRNRS